jgi:DNA mismatch repair ATPase MutL
MIMKMPSHSGISHLTLTCHSLSLLTVRLFGQGLDIIEVSDDGCGVSTSSRPYLATRYATSKISTFEDIYSGTGLSMGFRGEALFSMACLSEKLVVATRTETDEMAQKLEFQRDGSLDPQSVASIHRKVGTTVAVVKPFAGLPARRADITRRIRAERSKLFRLMESCKCCVLLC